MTYSHNSVKMTATTVNAHATKAARSSVGNAEGSSGHGGGYNKQNYSNNNNNNNRRTPPHQQQHQLLATTPTSGAALAFPANNNNYVISHSNSIACSTNIQQHPLMGVEPSPPGTGGFLMSTPTSGSNYFGNQRKQQRISCGSDVSSSSSSSCGGTYFNKNNNNSYAGQYYQNNNNNNINNNRRSIKQQQQLQLQLLQQQLQIQILQQQRGDQNQRTPNSHQARHSPAAVLGGGISGSGSANSHNIGGKSSGNKRRPKTHFQSPVVSAPCDLGVGGNISPTHPLLPAVLTHFAGSKCFDAPAPSAVPKPPQHWMQLDAAADVTATAVDDNLKKMQQKTINNAGPGLKNIINAHNNAITLKTRSAAIALMGMVNNNNNSNNSGTVGNIGNGDMHTCGGHVVKSSKRNLLEDFDTHNLKLLLNVQS